MNSSNIQCWGIFEEMLMHQLIWVSGSGTHKKSSLAVKNSVIVEFVSSQSCSKSRYFAFHFRNNSLCFLKYVINLNLLLDNGIPVNGNSEVEWQYLGSVSDMFDAGVSVVRRRLQGKL
jgi:hypothetical protein